MAKNLGFYPAKNYTKGRGRWSGRADIIVFHTTAGAAGLQQYENNPTKNPSKFSGSMGWFCSPTTPAQTSSHFITDRDGRYLQVVKFEDMAWCNGNNATMRQHAKVKPIIKQRVDNANLYTYSIESEGSYGSVGDPPGTEAQKEAILECVYLIIDDMYKNGVKTFFPDRDHMIGHCHISPTNRVNCPAKNYAANYPFDYFIEKAKSYIRSKYPNWINLDGTGEVDTPTTPPTTNPPSDISGIKVGDKVKILNGATWYGSSTKINSVYIEGKIYTVDSLRGDRAVLDKNGINSPINVKYLTVVSRDDSNTTDSNTTTFNVGDSVVINAGAYWYNSSTKVPSWAIGKVYTIDELAGTRAVLSKATVNSPIDTKYLSKEDVKIKVGDTVKIQSGAKWYNTNSTVPSWALSQTYTVDELSGNRALLSKKGINSPIDVCYLVKVN